MKIQSQACALPSVYNQLKKHMKDYSYRIQIHYRDSHFRLPADGFGGDGEEMGNFAVDGLGTGALYLDISGFVGESLVAEVLAVALGLPTTTNPTPPLRAAVRLTVLCNLGPVVVPGGFAATVPAREDAAASSFTAFLYDLGDSYSPGRPHMPFRSTFAMASAMRYLFSSLPNSNLHSQVSLRIL